MRRSTKSARARAGFLARVAPKLSRPRRRQRNDRQPRRRRPASSFGLRQEQLEQRLAMAVNVSGFPNAVDFAGQRLIDDGVAVIASDSGDDVFIKQVATVVSSPLVPPTAAARQDLLVADNGSFFGYTPIHDIDAYHGIFVTNATRRFETVVPVDRQISRQSSFLVSREELTGNFNGTLSYLQADGTRSTWNFQDGASSIISGPGVSSTLPAGYIYPLSISLDANPNSTQEFEQSSFVISWSDVPASLDRARVDTITYDHSDSIPGVTTATEFNLGMNVATGVATGNVLRFSLPGNFAATDDGNTLHESLGVVPGSLEGTLSIVWTGGSGVSFDFRNDYDGNVVFSQPGFGSFNSYAAVDLGGFGWISVAGGRIDNGVLTVSVNRWDALDTATWTDVYGVARTTFQPLTWSRAVPGVPGPAELTNVSYLTYTRNQVPNEATFFPGQTITREVTVDLLTPGSTVNIDSPIRVAQSIRENGSPGGGDVDLRVTNINVRATTAAPDRFFVGHSQSSTTDRLTLPEEEDYIVTPSLPGFYTGRPAAVTAQAIVEVDSSGRVAAVVLPEGTGFGYAPAAPPRVRIAAPALGGRQATAIANVAADGRVTGFTVTDPGAGYDIGWAGVRPIATVENAIGAIDASARVAQIDVSTGSVVRIDVLVAGSRYHAPPLIVVDPPAPGSDSRQATARAFIDAAGQLTAIEVVDPGQGYRARPVVRVQRQSPVAYAETVNFLADVSANIYEMYVGDDLGTTVPRGIISVTAEGRLSAAGVDTRVVTVAVPVPGSLTRETFTVDSAGFPPGFNPTGLVITGRGIRPGTRVLAWNPATNTVTVARGSVTVLDVPSFAVIEANANSLYLEATTADVYVEGQINVSKQSYLINSDASRSVLAPFFFTTASPITGTQTGVIQGAVVNVTLGNDAPTALTGATAFNTVDVTTRVDSLRTTAAFSKPNPRGAFPYDLTIRSQQDISIDAVAASSRAITIESLGDIVFNSAVDTQGDLRIEASAEDPAETASFRVTSPISTSLGRITIAADDLEVRNSVVVSAAAVTPGRDDIVLEARRGNLTLQANVSAVNDVVLRQTNKINNGTAVSGRIDGDLARVTAEGVEVEAEGAVRLRTDAVTLSGNAGTGFAVSELNDIEIPLLSSGGLVDLEALGVDPGPDGANPRALIANLLDVGQLVVNTPNGSAFVEANTDGRLILGNAAEIYSQGVRARGMTAAGDVVVRSRAGDIVALDSPISGGSARTVRAVTLGRLPSSTSYLGGTPGVRPSTLSGEGSINGLTAPGGGPLWGYDGFGRPISLVVGDRVLVNGQSDLPGTQRIDERRENGLYIVTKVGGRVLGSSRWELTRSADTDTSAEAVPNTLVRVLEGPQAGRVYAMQYDIAPRTRVERISGNVLQLPDLFPAFDLLTVGQAVTGPDIAPNSFISAIDRSARTVTLDVLNPGQFYKTSPVGFVNATWASTAAEQLAFDASFLGFNNLTIGQAVFGEGISPGAKIGSINPAERSVTVVKADGTPGALPLQIGSATIGRALGVASVSNPQVGQVTLPLETSWLGDIVLNQRIDLLNEFGERIASRPVGGVNVATGEVSFPAIAADGAAPATGISFGGNYTGVNVAVTTSWLGDLVIGQTIVLENSSGNALARRTVTSFDLSTGRIDFGPVPITAGVPVRVTVAPTILPTTVRLLPDYDTQPVTQQVGGTLTSRYITSPPLPQPGQRIVLFDSAEDPITSRIVQTAAVVPVDLDGNGTADSYDIVITFTTPLSVADQARVASWYALPVAAVRFGNAISSSVNTVAGEPNRLELSGFTNFEGLFVGQLVTGAGILSNAVVTGIDTVASTIDVTPGALPREIGPKTIARRVGRAITMVSFTTQDAEAVRVGQRAEFLDAAGAVLGTGVVFERNPQTRSVTFRDAVVAGAVSVRFLPVATVDFGIDGPGAVPVTWNLWQATNVTPGRPEVLTLPSFVSFGDLSLGLEVYGPNVPLGAVITRIDAATRQVTLSAAPLPGTVTQVSFAVGPTALHPASATLTLPPSFTHWSRLFPGQQVFGAGVAADAVITAVNPTTRTITLNPVAVAPARTNVPVFQADDFTSPYYAEGYDDWIELDPAFNDFADIVIGQRVEFFKADGRLIGNGVVTGLDPTYRTIGLADGALTGIAADVASISLLPVSAVRFGALRSLGSGFAEFALPSVGLVPITFTERDVVTNIGTDLATKTVTYVVSTPGTTNSTTGSLGKMITAFQKNDVAETVTEVAVRGVTLTTDPGGVPDGGAVVQLDSLFSAFDRLVIGADVVGTARLLTTNAILAGFDAATGTVTLGPGSLSELGLANSERIDRLRLTLTTLNPDQATDFRFWAYGSGDIRLTQELPLIEKPMAIDGRRISADGLVSVAPSLSRVVVDGQRVTRTRSGRAAAGGEQLNGFEVVGQAAGGTRIANLSVGGFTNGVSIRVDSASHVVVDSVRVGTGLSPTRRLPTLSGITVTGRRAAIVSKEASSITVGPADRSMLLSLAVGKPVELRGASGNSLGRFTVREIAESSLRITFDRGVPATASTVAIMAEDNTILNSFVGGGLSSAITIEGESSRSYVVGTIVGNSAIDSVTGIVVASSGNFIGVDAIPDPQKTAATLIRGSNEVAVSRNLFASKVPLIGLAVAGTGIPVGTRVVGIDSVASVVYLDRPVAIAAERTTTTITLGYMGTRIAAANVIQLDSNVPLDEVFVGQAVSGDGITANTTIVAIDRSSRKITVSQPLPTDGAGFVKFAAPAGVVRNDVQNNRRGIVLRGDNNRVTNTNVINNTENGIEIVHGNQEVGQIIGTQVATGVVTADTGFLLASWGVTVPLVAGARALTLPATFTDTAALRVGMPVHGAGIAPGTTLSGIVPSSTAGRGATLNLSAPVTLSSSAAAVHFGLVTAAGVPLRWRPESLADVAQLFVGQSVHGAGIPEYTRITGIRTTDGMNGLLMLSTPLAGLPATARTFAALAAGGGLRMAEVSAGSNVFYGNGGLAIRITKSTAGGTDVGLNRIARNRFEVTASGAAATANVAGSIRVFPPQPAASYVPDQHVPSTFSRTDRLGNQFGEGTLPPDDRGSTGPRPPRPPGIPIV